MSGRELNQRALDALRLLEEGRAPEAEVAFEAILAESEIVNDAVLPETCGELAGVKFELGKLDEARALYERALREAKRLSSGAETSRVGVCRYFLGEFLVRTGYAADAREH